MSAETTPSEALPRRRRAERFNELTLVVPDDYAVPDEAGRSLLKVLKAVASRMEAADGPSVPGTSQH